MQMKTSELAGPALDWAVSYCRQGYDPHIKPYSTDWAQGGPLIEDAKLVVSPDPQLGWVARSYMDATQYSGPTPLVAAMRCYVASHLGDEVDVPEGL